MSDVINLILAFSIILGVMLANRIYQLDKGNFLYQITAIAALCTTGLAFLEYEIARQWDMETVLKLSSYHTILCTSIIFLGVISIWSFTEPVSKEKYPHLNKILLLSNFLFGSFILLSEFSGHPFVQEVSYSNPFWEYELRSDGFRVILFQVWHAAQLIAVVYALSIFYIKSENPKLKQWRVRLILISFLLLFSMFYLFAFNGVEISKGVFFISPWMLICIAFFGYIYTNFKLFTVSPINAFDNILELMSNMIAIADLDFKITYVNKATLDELQMKKGQSLKAIRFHDIAQRFKASNWAEATNKITELQKGEKYIKEFELSHKEKSLYYIMTFSPIYNNKNTKTGYLAIATNVTQSKRSEKKLQQSNYELEQSNKELERFVYIASHDLKTPLRSVSSFLTLIKRRIQENYNDPTIQEFLDFAINGAEQMHHLIQDVLEVSKIETGNYKQNTILLNDIINAVCQTLKAPIEEKNAVVFSEPLPVILGDKSRMLQLFQNMIENGIKYNNSSQPSIYIAYVDKGDAHQITIKDNGIGIDEHYKDQIFEMFRRLHRNAEYEGTGIGLAICKKIVIQAGGNINLRSKLGEGSQFIITLPKVPSIKAPVKESSANLKAI